MIGGFKTVNLAWVNKFAMISFTKLHVYQIARSYEGRINAAPECKITQLATWFATNRLKTNKMVKKKTLKC